MWLVLDLVLKNEIRNDIVKNELAERQDPVTKQFSVSLYLFMYLFTEWNTVALSQL